MARTEVYFYRDRRGRMPVPEWLDELASRDPIAHQHCLARLEALEREGH